MTVTFLGFFVVRVIDHPEVCNTNEQLLHTVFPESYQMRR
jgi:hypothetical protein